MSNIVYYSRNILTSALLSPRLTSATDATRVARARWVIYLVLPAKMRYDLVRLVIDFYVFQSPVNPFCRPRFPSAW